MNENNNESLWLSLDEEIAAGLEEGKKWDAVKKGAKAVGKGAGRVARASAYTLAGATLGALVGGVPGAIAGGIAGSGVGAGEIAYKYKKDSEQDLIRESYNDVELYGILESCGYEPTISNLEILKRGLANGTIALAEEVESPAGASDAKEELEKDSIETEKPTKEVEKNLESEHCAKKETAVAIKESRMIRSHTDGFIKSYLTEDCNVSLSEANSLTEDEKNDLVRELAKCVATAISTKLANIDTSVADKSHGDVKELKILPDIQNAISQLEAIMERTDEYDPKCKNYLGIVIKSILYLNQYSAVFKEAYRNKKTLLILKYETVVLSIVSSLAYLISEIVDFRSQSLGMKPSIHLEKIAPLKTLEDFNKSVDSGEFKIITNDVKVLREYYKELPVEKLSMVCEANNIVGLVVDGINSIYDGLDKNKITTLLYKATGVVVLLLSVRDAIYSLSRMKTKASDMLAMISNFANINLGGGMKSLASFASRFPTDVESASEMAANEISDDNRRMSAQLKAIKAAPVLDAGESISKSIGEPSIGKQEPILSANDVFNF